MKRKDIYFIGLMLLAIVLVSAKPIFAGEDVSSMMCDEGVVTIGESDVDVWAACGEPESQSMNEWWYVFGPSQPSYILIFQDGKVVRIIESETGN